jgi:hypothetical protein
VESKIDILAIDRAITDCLVKLHLSDAHYVIVIQSETHACIGTNIPEPHGPPLMLARALEVMQRMPDIERGDTIGHVKGRA